MEGRGHKDGIHTEVERVSRFMLAAKVKQISSEQAIEAQKAMFAALPAEARKSTTLDNGRENHRHMELAELGMATYFADPYSSFRWKDSSWQRGTNEYHNGLLRRYLPKGSSFEDVDDDELADIVSEINNRPRKVLGFNTPLEVYNRCLGVRIQLRTQGPGKMPIMMYNSGDTFSIAVSAAFQLDILWERGRWP